MLSCRAIDRRSHNGTNIGMALARNGGADDFRSAWHTCATYATVEMLSPWQGWCESLHFWGIRCSPWCCDLRLAARNGNNDLIVARHPLVNKMLRFLAVRERHVCERNHPLAPLANLRIALFVCPPLASLRDITRLHFTDTMSLPTVTPLPTTSDGLSATVLRPTTNGFLPRAVRVCATASGVGRAQPARLCPCTHGVPRVSPSVF